MLQITPREAQSYIDAFYTAYPAVRAYHTTLLEQCRERGYVETFFGRKRYIPSINDRNRMIRSASEREAINMPIQGTCADIIKYAMLSLQEKLQTLFPRSKLLLQVHDELVFEVHKEEREACMNMIQKTMEQVVDWKIPLSVSISSGNNWKSAK